MNARTKTPSPYAELLAQLTERDRSMLDLLAAGSSSASIAAALGYQEGTMRVYLHHLYAKIGVWWPPPRAWTKPAQRPCSAPA